MPGVLLALTIVSAVLDWVSRLRHMPRLEVVTKPLTTVLVIGLALVGDAPTAQRVVGVIALVLCLVGDIVLMPVIDKFVIGLASFLLGHVVFVVLFAQYGFDRWWLGAVALAATVVLVATVGRRIVSAAGTHDAALKVPVAAYLTVISVMTVTGWATGMLLVVLGSTLFVISDSILGWARFVQSRGWMSVAIMVTYHGAIALLALSLW